MDFKSLLSKIDSIEAPQATPAAPELPKAVQLNEDAELRVLAGTSSILEEAKKMKKDEKKEEKVDEATKTPSTWTDMKGNKHPATKVKGDKYQGKEADDEDKKDKKAKKESIEPEFKSKFMKMVEAKKAEKKAKKEKMEEAAKPDFLDMDKDGNKKEPMKKAVADKKKGAVDKDVKEADEKRAPAKKSEREVTLPSGAKVKATKVQGWQSQKADKEAAKEKNESKMMPKGKKRPVKESVEAKLSFRDMMKLVVESGGQQQIDPLDKELFAWATRVAEKKLGEGFKAEVYAGMVYERMGGRFEMFDVLSEDQK